MLFVLGCLPCQCLHHHSRLLDRYAAITTRMVLLPLNRFILLDEMLRPEVSPQVDNLPSSQTNEHTHGTEREPLHPLVGTLVCITQTLLTRAEIIHLCDDLGDHLLEAAEVGLNGLELLLRLDGGPIAGVSADLNIKIDFT